MNCKQIILAMLIIDTAIHAAWADTNTGKMPVPLSANGTPRAQQSYAPAEPNCSVHYKGWCIVDSNSVKIMTDPNKTLIIKPKGRIDYGKIQAYLKIIGKDKVVVQAEPDAMPVIVSNADHYPMATGFAGTFESPMPQVKP
jgi:hypothetical protein